MKSKSDSNIKNIDFNPHILEPYLLDSLCRDLPQFAKVKERPIVQTIQISSVHPNPPKPMAAIFGPLRFPVV